MQSPSNSEPPEESKKDVAIPQQQQHQQQPSVPRFHPPPIPAELLQPDVSAEETLRAQNKSRTTSAGNVSDLSDLFIPPPSLTNGVGKKDPPTPALPSPAAAMPDFPLPAEPPPMRLPESMNEPARRHRRFPSTIRFTPGHERQVSWGLDTSEVEIPPLSAASGTDMAPPRRRAMSGRISIEDLQNRRPMETEAETYIIKALETRDIHGERQMAQVGPVLTNIPREDLDALEPEPDSSLATTSGTNSKESSQRRSSSDNPSKTTTSDGAGVPPGRPMSVRRAPSKAVAASHRRTETVGDQLELLAAHLDEVHIQHMDLVTDEHNEAMLPAHLQHKTDDATGGNNAGDALQQNANLLFNRHRTQTEEKVRDEEVGEQSLGPVRSGEESASTAASKRWSMFHSNLENIRSPVSDNTGLEEKAFETIGEMEEEQDDDDEVPQMPTSSLGSGQEKDKPNENGTSAESVKELSFKARTHNKFVTELEEFFAPRRQTINNFLRTVMFIIILPCTGIAALLFYAAGNPPTGKLDLDTNFTATEVEGYLVNTNGEVINSERASSSWWLIFVGVRQVITFVLAKAVELFFIDFLSVRSRFAVKVCGPWITLFILQTKGWPFLIFMWGVINSALLTGTKPFFHHWAYWQDYIGLFNRMNPSGTIVNNPRWHELVIIFIVLGIVVSFKRFWLGLHLGRQTFVQYSDKLASLMKKILYISEAASLGRSLEIREKQSAVTGVRRTFVSAASYGLNQERFEGLINNISDDSTAGGGSQTDTAESITTKRVIDPEDRLPLTGSLSAAQKARISQLLGQWEEPTIAQGAEGATKASVTELLQFRRALEYLNTSFPFSGSFGIADTRESTIESAQEVYRRLLYGSPDPGTLPFDVIAVLGVNKDGALDQEKLKELIKLFRPDRDGSLECIDFVKAVDTVYKEIRLLRASVANSSKIDRAFESIFNFIFYAIVLCVILSQIGFDPFALFLSISGVILAFAFMIGSASSKYFEGLLFIIVRRPYQIGDGIAVSDVNDELDPGSPFWFVEDVDLFTTKVMFQRSQERATLSNGSLANSRIINVSLSKQAKVSVKLKFPVSVSYEKLQVYHQALGEFFKNRPREWSAFLLFVLVRIEADQGYMEYAIVARHRQAWVAYADILRSRADLMQFSMELSKKLDISYRNPPLPVDLSIDPSSTKKSLWPNGLVQSSLEPAEDLSSSSRGNAEMEALMSPPASDFQASKVDLRDLQRQFRPGA